MRAESRAADKTAQEATEAAHAVRAKLREATQALDQELANQIDTLDPVQHDAD